MRPSSDLTSWALCAYPVSTTYREQLQRWLGGPVQIVVLSEIRRSGIRAVLAHLWRARHGRGVVLLQDAASTPLAPVLRFIISFSRCRQLATVSADGRVVPFTRFKGWLELPRLLAGSMRGAFAAVRCYVELRWLARCPPARHPLNGLRRVAFLKTNLWFGVKAGGSVGHVAGVANALADRCPRVHLFSVEEPPLLRPEIAFHPVVHGGAFGYPYEINYYVYQHAFARRTRALPDSERPSLVYHRLSLANYSGVRLARDVRVPLVVEYNGSEVWVSKHWGTTLKLPRLAALAEDVELQHADLVVTVSEVLGHELRDRGIPPERVLVHPNCVDPQRFDPDRHTAGDRQALLAHHGISGQATVCGFIGTFGMWHGVTLLADAIAELATTRAAWLEEHQVHFLLIGDGLCMPQVRATLAPAGISRFVTLTGLVEQDRAAAYLAACDVLLSPHVPNPDGSPFFGSPTKLFEYMAMARGIVASDLDQIGEILSPGVRPGELDNSGTADALAVLVKPGDRQDFIRGLTELVERPHVRRQLGRNARRAVLANYTWERNIAVLLARLHELATSTQPGAAPL